MNELTVSSSRLSRRGCCKSDFMSDSGGKKGYLRVLGLGIRIVKVAALFGREKGQVV